MREFVPSWSEEEPLRSIDFGNVTSGTRVETNFVRCHSPRILSRQKLIVDLFSMRQLVRVFTTYCDRIKFFLKTHMHYTKKIALTLTADTPRRTSR